MQKYFYSFLKILLYKLENLSWTTFFTYFCAYFLKHIFITHILRIYVRTYIRPLLISIENGNPPIFQEIVINFINLYEKEEYKIY